jgi:hypothetical protein
VVLPANSVRLAGTSHVVALESADAMAMRVREIVLSTEEQQELVHVATCYPRAHKDVQRPSPCSTPPMGMANVEIAERLDMSPIAVQPR